VMRISSAIAERPSCPTCKRRMGLARLSPGEEGFEERIFECGICHQTEKVLFPIDPLKTDRGLVGQRAKAAALASHKSQFNRRTRI
jgi:hypothetical protein